MSSVDKQVSYGWPYRVSPQITAIFVGIHGLFLLVGSLLSQLVFRMPRLLIFDAQLNVYVTLLLGVALLYVSLALLHRKYSAWIFTLILYILLFGLTVVRQLASPHMHYSGIGLLQLGIILSLLIDLWLTRKMFVVHSDYRGFTHTLRVGALVLIVTTAYGVGGYMLMDAPDYHIELTPVQALQFTVDQFGLIADHPNPLTSRAVLFEDSLTFLSLVAGLLVFVSLFQPVRARYVHHTKDTEAMRALVYESAADSEDYFKLWPNDKLYLFSANKEAGIAYKTQQGYAMAVGAPVGDPGAYSAVLKAFHDDCFVNDWKPVFVHVLEHGAKWLQRQGYRKQLIGQEAVVDTQLFVQSTQESKYFREIATRFHRLRYTTEMLMPPHTDKTIRRLRQISNEWLERPGRTERGFMLGYFSEPYMQQCRILVARDESGVMQGFVNLVPSPLPTEANIDLFRSGHVAPGNINDYILMALIQCIQAEGIPFLNLGLCPFAGVADEKPTVINRVLRLAYNYGERVYSFKGLQRFKAKYDPLWRKRYFMYRGLPTEFPVLMQAFDNAVKSYKKE